MLQMPQDLPFFYAQLLAELPQGEPAALKKLCHSLPQGHLELPSYYPGMIHLGRVEVQDQNLEIKGEFTPKTPNIPQSAGRGRHLGEVEESLRGHCA